MRRGIKIPWKPGIAALTVFLTGCVTAIPFTVQRLPTLNTLGIKSLAVMPFETSDNSELQRQTASVLTSEAQSRIQATNHFTMIASSQIERYRQERENLENHVDALFTGKIISITVSPVRSSEAKRYNIFTKETYTVTVYEQTVDMAFEYGLTRTRDGSIIGPVRKNDRIQSSVDNDQSNLASPQTVAHQIAERNMRGLARDVAPYTVTERRPLMKETVKDKGIQARAKDANAWAKSGQYKLAQEAFISIYFDTKSFPAAYNASLLISVLGDREGAVGFLQQVYNDTGNPKANAEIARLRQEMENEGLVAAFTEGQNQREKLVTLMVNEISAKLPPNVKPAIINNTKDERELAEVVIRGITSGLLAKNIIIVDRNEQARMAEERMYQLSGNVSDDDIVSIGNEAGASAFIMVNISGTFGNRRLSVQVLDTARGTVLYQSPQTDEMNL